MKQPVISIIVPTKNSESNLQSLFNSLVASDFKDFEIIINDDVTSNDNTNSLVSEFKGKGIRAKYLKENKSMAQGRLVGAHFAKGSILLHLDSDMEVTPKLLAEIADKMKGGSDALVIPEESFGTTFWARCKWLEKKCYEGVEEIESLRAINRELYVKLEGHDESMVFSEDKDLDIRARAAGARVGRTSCILKHNEGDLSLLHSLKK